MHDRQKVNPTKGIESLKVYIAYLVIPLIWTQQRELKDILQFLLVYFLHLENPTKGIESSFIKASFLRIVASNPTKGIESGEI